MTQWYQYSQRIEKPIVRLNRYLRVWECSHGVVKGQGVTPLLAIQNYFHLRGKL